jgi:charged multivesicular body protein 4A/B
MEQEAIDERMLTVGAVPVADLSGGRNTNSNQAIRTGKGQAPAAQVEEQEDEEEELRKLQAEMAM